MLDSANPVAVNVSMNNSHSASNLVVAARFIASGNGGSNVLNLPSSNNSEKPLPLELHSAPLPVQVSVPHSVAITICYSYITSTHKISLLVYKTEGEAQGRVSNNDIL